VSRSGARFRDESGQSLILVALAMVVFFIMAGFVIDVARAYVAYRHLQAAADAAVLAAAQYPDPTNSYLAARNKAIEYSAGDDPSPHKNYKADLPGVVTIVKLRCVRPDGTVYFKLPSDGDCEVGEVNNGISVSEKGNISLFFGKFLGIDTLSSIGVSAKATALFKGGVPHPLDVMIVTDTTGSMNNNCSSTVAGISDLGFTPTGLDCAKEGIRAFLGSMWPCQQGLSSCGTPDSTGNVPNPVDKIGLMVFPALCTATGSPCSSLDLATRKDRERDCTGNLSNSIGSDVTYDPLYDDYLVVPFSSDFRTSASSPINGDSNLLKSVWWYQCPGHAYPSGSGPASIGGGPSSSSDRNGASNGSIGAGPSSSSDRNGANNASTIAGGGSSDRSGASNASTIGGGASGSSDRSSATTPSGGGSITFGSENPGVNSSSGASTIVINKPSSIANDEVLVAGITVNGGSNTTITAPSGWTLIRRTNNGTNVGIASYYHVVTSAGSEPASYSFGLSGSSTLRASGGILRYTGVDTTNPVDVSNGTTNNNNQPQAPSVTTTVANDRVIGLYGLDTNGSFTPASGLTERYDVTNTSTSGPATEAADYTQVIAGSTGNKTATATASNNWAAQLVALKPVSLGAPSITLNRPSNRADGDLLLASVTARNLDGNICAPDDGTWTQVRQDRQPMTGSPAITHATFWSVRSGTSAESYTFTFSSGSCSAGSPVSVPASAVAVRYTGVDATAPVDVSASGQGTDAAPTAPTATTTLDDDRVVRLWGTGATSFSSGTSFSSSGSGTATGVSDLNQATAGPTGTATANTGSTSAPWAAHTVALKAAGASSITIGRPSNRAAGDLMLVSVTARNLDGGSICAPADGTWTLLRQDTQGLVGSSVTHATFWSVRSGSFAEFYTFTFDSGSCGGAPIGTVASAIAVRYTGVDPITPIDVSAGSQGNTGSGTTLNAPQVTTNFANDRVVSLYGSRCGTAMGSVTYSGTPSSGTSTGFEDVTQATPGLSTAQSATSCTNADWVAHTVALKPAIATSITISRPSNRADGDFLLVSVTARNLDAGSICAPDGSWTLLRQDTQGAAGSSVTHATFWSFRSGTSSESYTFAFSSGSCGGSPVSVAASAVVVRYTGVDPITPIDVSAGNQGNTGSGTTLNAPQVTTNFDNDRVVSLYGSRCGTPMGGVTYPFSGSGTSTGVEDAAQAAAGLSTPQFATSCMNTEWVAHTVALKAAVGSLTINRPNNRAAGDFLLASVTARNLGGGKICAPSDWTLVREDTQPDPGGVVTHATFWSFRSGNSAESYTFTFSSGACGGSPVGVVASAVVVRYTGVDPIFPIDVSAGNQGNTGSGTTLNAPQVTTNFANDRVVSLYGSRCTTMGSVTYAGIPSSGTSTGVEDATQATAGLSTAQSATSCTNTDWVAHTVALRFIGNCSPCDYGVEAGGYTYYTEAIKAAQNELTTNGRPNAQHVIIILGDGEVNTTIAGDTQPCRSAIAASQNAQSPPPPTPPTWVYAIAYDSSGSCTVDSDIITVGSSSSAANSSSGASTLVITKPSGVVNNDVLVASVAVSGGSNTTITVPSGWTQIRRTNNSTTVGIASYYHVVTNGGSEPASYIWSLTSGTRASGGITRYLGVDTSSPIDTSGGGTGSSTTPTAPSVTTNGANELVVGLFGTGVSATYTAPSGMTERYAVTNANASGPATEAADYTQATASSTGTKAATASASAGWAAQLVALQPAGLSSISAVCLMHRIADPFSSYPGVCADNSNSAANNAKRFFNQPGAGDLTAVFTQIGNDLTTTRLVDDG